MSPRQFLASFDVEDWFHGIDHWFGTANPPSSTDWTPLEARVERNTHQLLDILAEAGARSTLFVLGWIARRYPALVRRMVAEGHEVASHTDMHRLLYTLSAEELVDDLARARDTLEQLTGAPVWGIRAPNFSISETVLRCLAEAGYWYDSSLFPFTAHRRYGKIPGVADPDQPVLELMPGLLELPMSRVAIGPLRVPWAGGAYFRLIPYRMFRWGVARRLKVRSCFMFYLHPWELDAEEVPPPGMRRLQRLRPYMQRRRTQRDLRRL
ncbi:MAG: DUF3473 domain-containing protein, partial [Chloroflexi bacterium]